MAVTDSATPFCVALDHVSKVYGKNPPTQALDDLSVRFPRGSFTAVMGPSDSGKSTFLHCAAGLDRPTSGSVR
ncbi:MAG: ATP-binding cassette domain-containing protein, partial [Sciscionella sp.]